MLIALRHQPRAIGVRAKDHGELPYQDSAVAPRALYPPVWAISKDDG